MTIQQIICYRTLLVNTNIEYSCGQRTCYSKGMPVTIEKPPKLTEKQARFVQYKLQGLPTLSAARKAGYSEQTARRESYVILKRPDIIEALGWTLEQLGITYQAVAEPIALGLKATRQESYTRREKDGKGTYHTVTNYRTVPDIAMRMRAAAIAWRMLEDRRKENPDPINPFATIAKDKLDSDKLGAFDAVQLQSEIFENKDKQ